MVTFGPTTVETIPNNTSNNLFASSSTSTNTNLFGSSTATPSSGIFGSSNTSTGPSLTFGNNSSSTGTLFGSTNTPAPSNGLFGANNSSSWFSSTPASSSASGLFASNPQTSFTGSNNNSLNLQNVQEAAFPWWLRELLFIQSAYSNGEGSRLSTYMFDRVPDELNIIALSSLEAYEKIKEERKKGFFKLYPWLDERQWAIAEKQCPDGYLPTLIIGVEGLCKRVEEQVASLKDQMTLLSDDKIINDGDVEIETTWLNKIKDIGGFHLQNSIKKCQKQQQVLDEKLVRIVGRVESYIALVSNKKITPEEREFHERVKKLKQRMTSIATESSAVTSNLKSSESLIEQRVSEESKLIQFSAVDSGSEVEMVKFLAAQKDAIERLLRVVKKDIRDISIMRNRQH